MFQALKLMSLAGALKARGNAPEAFSAVVELGRIGSEKAVDLLMSTFPRRDGVARAAAKELGRIAHPKSFQPLADQLAHPDVSQAAREALTRIGAPAIPTLVENLKSAPPAARVACAVILGDIQDRQGLDALIESVQTDDHLPARAAAAVALGQLKDPKAIWVLVHALRLRDETDPARQAALEELRHAASRALHKIGSPLAMAAAQGQDVEGALRELEQAAATTDAEVHPSLIGDLHLLSEADLVGVLQELIRASEEVSWAALERRDPMLAGWFKSYEHRAAVAQTVGKELHRRGGPALMRRIFEEKLERYASIGNWWTGIGNWSPPAAGQM